MIRPSSREPIFNLPGVVLVSLLILIGIHALRVFILSDELDFRILVEGSFVPARWMIAYGGLSSDEVLNALLADRSEGASAILGLAQYILSDGGAKPWTGLTYALLHGSWTHVAMNGVWLAAFGTPVARRVGPGRFLVLAAATALAGALAYMAVHPRQVLPLIGASASVSGMMGAAAWFMFSPASPTAEGHAVEPHERPREALSGLLANRQILLFVAVWLVINYLSAAFAGPLGMTDASIAWEAHVGGFLAGLILFPFIDPVVDCRTP